METILYTVQPGDSLWTISRRFGTTVAELARMNSLLDPDRLSAGQTLRVAVQEDILSPSTGSGAMQPEANLDFSSSVQPMPPMQPVQPMQPMQPAQPMRPAVPAQQGSPWYTVQPGDSLWIISQRSGTPVETLAWMNDIERPETIYPGQRLRVHP